MRSAGVGDLAEVLRCDRSNVSRIVDRNSTRGLVKRHKGKEDGRVTLSELAVRNFCFMLISHIDYGESDILS
jgi:DNA-binding MarR family transcriptional regulator